MKISEAVISWTPQTDTGHPGYAGKLSVHSLAEVSEHVHRVGMIDSRQPTDHQPNAAQYGIDERAHHKQEGVRRAYVIEVAKLMIERDGLDPVLVDTTLRNTIDEYRDAFPKAA